MAAIVVAGWLQVGLGQNLNEGLVAYYPFNGNANDESGNGNNGEVNGATLAEDRFGGAGKAYSFDGENDWIELPNPFNPGFFSTVKYELFSCKFIKTDSVLSWLVS